MESVTAVFEILVFLGGGRGRRCGMQTDQVVFNTERNAGCCAEESEK